MIFVWHLIFVTTICLGINEGFGFSNSTIRTFADVAHRQRGVNDPLYDRNWVRYLNQLKRLKLHEMKKAIRSKVLGEKVYPHFTVKEIRRRLELLELYDPDNTKVGYVEDASRRKAIHRTFSGQGIIYVKISEADEEDRDQAGKGRKFTRPIVVLVAGIGGSDWTAVHVMMNVISNLVTSYRNKKLSGFDWWIIPLLNPDGYINSMSDEESRYYKPNINPRAGCPGVNLDRNFLFQREFCHEESPRINCLHYPGQFPFSEVESRTLRDFIFHRAEDCKLFVAVKEGVNALVYPFASSSSPIHATHSVLQDLLCSKALDAFDQSHGGKKNLFKFGNTGRIFGLSSGFVEDWMRKHMGIPRSFAFYFDDSVEHKSLKRLQEYGQGTLKAINVLATSRRTETYAESFHELINHTKPSNLSDHRKKRLSPWGKELIHNNLQAKINRGAILEMPIEFTSDSVKSRYDHLDF